MMLNLGGGHRLLSEATPIARGDSAPPEFGRDEQDARLVSEPVVGRSAKEPGQLRLQPRGRSALGITAWDVHHE
jgi:hypothetical protein